MTQRSHSLTNDVGGFREYHREVEPTTAAPELPIRSVRPQRPLNNLISMY